MRRNQVVVIGAGIGGLVCAIELARAGAAVSVVEQAPTAGGKVRELTVDGVAVDSGPTVFTMKWVFDEVFAAAGTCFDDHVSLHPAGVLARHAWTADQRLDLFADMDRSADAIGAFSGSVDAASYRAFCAEASRTYQILRDAFLDQQQQGLIGLNLRVGLNRAGELLSLRPFETLWDSLVGHFRDPRLRQLFGRYATYCGSSPFSAPATLMLVAHVEREGVWMIDGGMKRLIVALETLARSLGVDFRFNTAAVRIDVEGGRASGVSLANGDRLAADIVVVNADPQALAHGAFGRVAAMALPRRPAAERSLSAMTWSLNAETRGFPLTRHNVFFSGDYRAEFADLVERGRLPVEPTVYVCAQDRDPPGQSPVGPERLLIIVNAPANGDRRPLEDAEISACRTRVVERLARCGLEIDPVGFARGTVTRPQDFNALYPMTGGALYGMATHGWTSSFRRPGARTRIPGLYLAGGAAHPGPGAPMAALSGRLAARRILSDQTAARPFGWTGVFGGARTP